LETSRQGLGQPAGWPVTWSLTPQMASSSLEKVFIAKARMDRPSQGMRATAQTRPNKTSAARAGIRQLSRRQPNSVMQRRSG